MLLVDQGFNVLKEIKNVDGAEEDNGTISTKPSPRVDAHDHVHHSH